MAEERRKGKTFVPSEGEQLPRCRSDVVHGVEECKECYDGRHGCSAAVTLRGVEEDLDVGLACGAVDCFLDVSD